MQDNLVSKCHHWQYLGVKTFKVSRQLCFHKNMCKFCKNEICRFPCKIKRSIGILVPRHLWNVCQEALQIDKYRFLSNFQWTIIQYNADMFSKCSHCALGSNICPIIISQLFIRCLPYFVSVLYICVYVYPYYSLLNFTLLLSSVSYSHQIFLKKFSL